MSVMIICFRFIKYLLMAFCTLANYFPPLRKVFCCCCLFILLKESDSIIRKFSPTATGNNNWKLGQVEMSGHVRGHSYDENIMTSYLNSHPRADRKIQIITLRVLGAVTLESCCRGKGFTYNKGHSVWVK